MRIWSSIVALSLCLALPAPAAFAAPARKAPACCRVPAGTVVMVELADPISTKVQKPGQTFAIRLSEPIIVNGQVVLRPGATGVGEVIEAAKPGLGGKAAKLVLAARYLDTPRGTKLKLKGLQLSANGKDNANAANALGIGGIGFGPLGIVAFAVRGGDVELPAGAQAMAKIADPVTLASLGRAPKGSRPTAEIQEARMPKGSIAVPPPPRGRGQVVFFRKKSILGTGQWFNVREDGKALGKLTNGAYFIEPVPPGLHTYTAKSEPEFKDSLKLNIDAGETYFVEGKLTKGVVIGIADLSPSDQAVFNLASKDLKPAPPPGDDNLKEEPAKGSERR